MGPDASSELKELARRMQLPIDQQGAVSIETNDGAIQLFYEAEPSGLMYKLVTPPAAYTQRFKFLHTAYLVALTEKYSIDGVPVSGTTSAYRDACHQLQHDLNWATKALKAQDRLRDAPVGPQADALSSELSAAKSEIARLEEKVANLESQNEGLKRVADSYRDACWSNEDRLGDIRNVVRRSIIDLEVALYGKDKKETPR